MQIAIAQLNPLIGDLSGNAQQILQAAQIAAAQGVRLLLTPELSLCGYPPRDLLLNPRFIEVMAQTLQNLATQLPPKLAVLVGTATLNPSAQTSGGKPLYNSIAYLEGGQIRQVFHKRLLPTYDVFDEERYFEPGLEANLLQIDDHQIGVTICEDLWNDEQFWGWRNYAVDPVAALAAQPVDLIINLSASPFCAGKQDLRESMLSHSARRHQCPMIYVNQVGANDDLIFDGCSVAVNRAGTLVGRAQAYATDLLTVTLDPQQRDFLPATVSPRPQGEDAEIWTALVLGVQDYARKCGFRQAVIGLSGGIDSALVAAIAAEAFGPENVLGVLMPSPYSSEHSIGDALDLAGQLGLQVRTLPIEPAMAAYKSTLAGIFAGTQPGVAEENLQARIRGNLLMAIANKFGHLLISTGNKSEIAVGYCTLYGDMSGGLAAISDVPKTRVYALCRWLNSDTGDQVFHNLRCKQQDSTATVIPTHILTKAPSAELKPDQLDQDSLPPYEVLDDILQRFIGAHQSVPQIVAAGHDPAVVERVVEMVHRAEFKRRQAPPGLKITDRAFGTGWRMPIAARSIVKSIHPDSPKPSLV